MLPINRPLDKYEKNQPFYVVKWMGKDITEDVTGDVTVEYCEGFIITAIVHITKGMYYLSNIQRNQEVKIWGGTIDDVASDGGNMPLLFSGNIYMIRSVFPETGLVTVELECKSTNRYAKTGITDTYKYPDKDGKRPWANKPSIKLSEIVRGIIENEMRCKVGTFKDGSDGIHIVNDTVFTQTRYEEQLCSTNWFYLRYLAEKSNCIFWEEFDGDGNTNIFFVDSDFNRGKFHPWSFLYLGRDQEDFEWSVDGTKYGVSELQDNQIKLLTCEFVEDEATMTGNVRFVPVYGSGKNGEDIVNVNLCIWDEKKKEYVYYELDEDKVAAAPEELTARILFHALDEEKVKWTEVLQLWKPVKRVDAAEGSKDYLSHNRIAVGIDCKISFPGSKYINLMNYYAIYGVPTRYSLISSNNPRPWFMRSLKHIIGTRGYIMEADLYA